MDPTICDLTPVALLIEALRAFELTVAFLASTAVAVAVSFQVGHQSPALLTVTEMQDCVKKNIDAILR